MFRLACSSDGVSHVASVLPIRVLEAASGKSLRIAGVAMVAGLSRKSIIRCQGRFDKLDLSSDVVYLSLFFRLRKFDLV